MKDRKGFTLVELLAVIVILAIILMITVPGVLSIISKIKEDSYQAQLRIIIDATRNYVAAERGFDWRDDGIKKERVITLKQLREKGYLENKIIDPRNKKEIKNVAVSVSQTNKSKNVYRIVYLDESGASYPSYSTGMIPIVYKNNKWVKADITNENLSWFDYEHQQWANIATVTEDIRDTIVKAKAGTEVPISKINGMYVWIPRYKYKLWNKNGTVGPDNNLNLAGDMTINVVMEDVSTLKSNGTENGKWLTHPAFTFGEEELSGFWVAKFETGYAGATSNDTATHEAYDPSKIVIVPNVYAWKSNNFSNMYRNVQAMKDNSQFGLTEVDDPRIIKNTEWGAMAYLSSSKYGKTGNPKYSGIDREVSPNQKPYQTGYGYGYTYDTEYGQRGSTTGNISGVYDTSGGDWEYVAGYIKVYNGSNLDGSYSGFTVDELNAIVLDTKHFDSYEYEGELKDFTRGHLGDAMMEMGPFTANSSYYIGAWYGDYASLSSSRPWIMRGSHASGGSTNGIFAFNGNTGGSSSPHGTYRYALK